MTDGQNNFTNMVDVMLAMMQKFIAIWNGNAKVTAAVAAVTSTNASIKATAGSQSQVNQGPTTNKHTLWIAAAEKADHVCCGLKCYADDIDDVVLAAAVHFTYNSLVRGNAIDAEIKMQTIHDKAAAINIALLTPFQVIANDITDLQTAINTFSAAAPMKRVMVSSGAAATSQLTVLFTTERGEIKKLDNLVNTYKKAEPVFVENYFNSREIIDLGKTMQAVELHLLPKHFESVFGKSFKVGDEFTIRNHSAVDMQVFLADAENILPTTNGIALHGGKDIKLEVPKDFGGVFGHWLVLYNPNTLDDVHVTAIHAHGKSGSSATTLGSTSGDAGDETATKLK